MKNCFRYFALIATCILLTGCARHINPDKFDIDHNIVKHFKSSAPIKVLVPENEEKNI